MRERLKWWRGKDHRRVARIPQQINARTTVARGEDNRKKKRENKVIKKICLRRAAVSERNGRRGAHIYIMKVHVATTASLGVINGRQPTRRPPVQSRERRQIKENGVTTLAGWGNERSLLTVIYAASGAWMMGFGDASKPSGTHNPWVPEDHSTSNEEKGGALFGVPATPRVSKAVFSRCSSTDQIHYNSSINSLIHFAQVFEGTRR
jgi:hypothetical protein